MAFKDWLTNVFSFGESNLWQMAPTGVKPERVSVSETQHEIWSSWTPLISGYLSEEPNRKLSWQAGSKIYDEMRRTDAQVNASLLAMELPIRATKRYIEPAYNEDGETEQEDEDIAKFVETAIFEDIDNSRDDLLRQILTMLAFWFSVFEKVYWLKQTDTWTKIILKKLAFRKQSTIERRQMPQTGAPWITQQLDTQATSGVNKWKTTLGIPAEKLVIFTHRREGDNYEWISALRSAYKHWFIKDKLYKYSAIKHERQWIWIPIIYLPKNATPWDKAQAMKIVKNIRWTEQTGVVMPWSEQEWRKFEYADLKSAQSTGMEKDIEHHNREIVKNILAQFLELWNTASGSRSLGESQTAYFLMALEATARYVADTINKYIVKQLVDFNYDVTRYPKLRFQTLQSTDSKDLVEMVTSLVDSEVLAVDEKLQDHFRELLDLPAKDADASDENIADDWTDSEDDSLPDMDEKELQDLEDELWQYDTETTDTQFASVAESIASYMEDVAETYEFRKPMSEETKKKISEALKKHNTKPELQSLRDKSKAKEEEINQSIAKERYAMETNIKSLRDWIDKLRSSAKSITRKRSGSKAREEVKKQIQSLKDNIKAIRESKKRIIEYKRQQKDKVKEVYRQSKKWLSVIDKADKEQARLQRKQQREAEKAMRRSNKRYNEKHDDDCGCGICMTKWMYFDNNYFTELSHLIDNNLIKTVQNDDNTR